MLKSLNQIDVANPCKANWEEMTGNATCRHCALCKKNVYNISEMTETEALDFLNSRLLDRPCIRFYRREDGTVSTSNCKLNKPQRAAAIAMIMGCTAALAIGGIFFSGLDYQTILKNKISNLENLLFPQVDDVQVMGEVCPPPPAPNTQAPVQQPLPDGAVQ